MTHDLSLDFTLEPHTLELLQNSPACTGIGMNTEQLPNILQWPTIVILKPGKKRIMKEQLGEVSSTSLLEEPLKKEGGD